MNVRFTPRFLKAFDSLPSQERKQAVSEAIQTFTNCVEQSKPIPDGIGLKSFHGAKTKYKEFRSSLSDRILFHWEPGGVVLRFVGSHNELRNFARENKK